MKIAITGASGKVARALVPYLQKAGHDLVLIGRDPENLSALYPQHRVQSLSQFKASQENQDVLLHLAALNNDVDAGLDAFLRVNRDLAVDIAKRKRIGRFVYASSLHALDSANQSSYAVSKRAGADALRGLDGDITILYLPFIQLDGFHGRLGSLNRLPKFMGRAVFQILAALKPVAHVSALADFLNAGNFGAGFQESFLPTDTARNWFYRGFRATLDIVFSLIILICFWWLFALLAFAIRQESPGRAIFRQERVGRNLKPFTLYKFRTMKTGTPSRASHEVSRSAVTRIGAFLRRSKLDEFPQVFNMLAGSLSLIGPRPSLFNQQELVAARQARGVYRQKPGITGWAQAHGIDMSDPEKLAWWDAAYIAQQSVITDLKILWLTFIGRGNGDRTK